MVEKEYVIRINNEIVGLEEQIVSGKTDVVQSNENLIREKKQSSVGKIIAVHMGKQALNYAVSNYGDLTGDYYMQENIQGAIQVAGIIGMAVMGGPVGWIAGAGILTITAVNQSLDLYRKNRDVAILKNRVGLMDYSASRK